jgi:type I restriction enzyme, S subunit
MKFKYSPSWTTSLLDDVTDRGSDHTPSQSSPEYWNGQIKWVSLADSSKLDNLFISNTDKAISELGIKNSSAVKHPAGTVILSRDAGVGKSAILKEEMAVSQHFIVWKCSSKNIIHNIYLYYWLQMMKHEFERMAVGSTIKTIGLPYFKKLEITYPPLLEQCRIAEMLGVWDESIDLLERLIGKTRSRKQGLMQQLLTGKKRFKEFDTKSSFSIRSSYFESKLGELPDDWNIINLPDVLYFQEGPGVQNHQFTQSGVKLLNGSNIQKAELTLDNTSRYIDEDEAYGKYKHFLVDAGDLVIASSGISVDRFEDKIAFVAEKDLPLCMNTSTIRFKVKDKMQVNLAYFKYFMMTALFKDQIRRQITGSAQLNFGPTHLNLTLLVLPRLPEQEKIAAVLSAADEEISTLEKQLAAYKQQKLGLMQQLLTGKIRVGII